uniref:Uncharacterized protein n=1 Tax=viral metagenome TaxID=1070528 RepID=A0A6M3J593_9ZZZZ
MARPKKTTRTERRPILRGKKAKLEIIKDGAPAEIEIGMIPPELISMDVIIEAQHISSVARMVIEDAKRERDTGGVTFDRRAGADCPMCRFPKCNVRDTMPWQDDIRIRYHVCRRCGHQFKSVEEYAKREA